VPDEDGGEKINPTVLVALNYGKNSARGEGKIGGQNRVGGGKTKQMVVSAQMLRKGRRGVETAK